MAISPAAQPRASIPIVWRWARLADLAAIELYAVMAARQLVFAVEQHCAYLDADGFDVNAWHLLGWHNQFPSAHLVAYLRVVDAGQKYAEPSIGRVLVGAEYRGTGLGRVLMTEGMRRTEDAFPAQGIRISAQQQLSGFYSSLGFRTVSDVYAEDGIPHVQMFFAPLVAGA